MGTSGEAPGDPRLTPILDEAAFMMLYERLRDSASWGRADRRGALNTLTTTRVAQAAEEIRSPGTNPDSGRARSPVARSFHDVGPGHWLSAVLPGDSHLRRQVKAVAARVAPDIDPVLVERAPATARWWSLLQDQLRWLAGVSAAPGELASRSVPGPGRGILAPVTYLTILFHHRPVPDDAVLCRCAG